MQPLIMPRDSSTSLGMTFASTVYRFNAANAACQTNLTVARFFPNEGGGQFLCDIAFRAGERLGISGNAGRQVEPVHLVRRARVRRHDPDESRGHDRRPGCVVGTAVGVGGPKHKKTSTQGFYAWMKRDNKGLYGQWFPFAFDVTGAVKPGQKNTVAILCTRTAFNVQSRSPFGGSSDSPRAVRPSTSAR